MRTVQFDNKKAVAARLAVLAGCSADELVITRNTTESLDMIIGGYPWAAGDEAIMALQDYGAMLKMFQQVEKRQGVKVACPEEIAYRFGHIDAAQLAEQADAIAKSNYGQYLRGLLSDTVY